MAYTIQEVFATCTSCHDVFSVDAEVSGRRIRQVMPHCRIKRGIHNQLVHSPCGNPVTFYR